jgi:hypothetical protein
MINILTRVSDSNGGFIGTTSKFYFEDRYQTDIFHFTSDNKVICKSDATEFALFTAIPGIEIEQGNWMIDDSEYQISKQKEKDTVISILNSIPINDTNEYLVSEIDFQICTQYAENYSSYAIALPNETICRKYATNNRAYVLSEDEYYRIIKLYYTNEYGNKICGTFTFRIDPLLNEKLAVKIDPKLKFNARIWDGLTSSLGNVVVQYNGTMNIVSLEPVPDAITLNLSIRSYKGLVVNSFTCGKVPPLEGIVITYPQFSGLLVNN